MKSLRFFLAFAFVVIVLVSACEFDEELIPESETLLEQTFSVDEVRLKVVDAQFRSSVQTHYLMHYPEPDYIYLEVIFSLDGMDASPDNVLTWGIENIALNCEDTDVALAYPRRLIVSENVEYKVGEEIDFDYVYIYSVLRDTDYATCQLVFSDGQQVKLLPFLKGSELPERPAQLEEKGMVLSGKDNEAYGENAVVGGGEQNSAAAIHTTVSGGNLNRATTSHATVTGGRENAAIGFYATVGGGYANTAGARDTFVGGGSRNTASGPRSTVAGGIQNQATASDTTITGGAYNQATDDYAFVGGGTRNLATGYAAVIGGGAGNEANKDQATIAGGLGNQVDGKYGVVGGGYGNWVSGYYATIPGGSENQAAGAYSFAAGQGAVVSTEHAGAFVLADASEAKFYSLAANEFAVRATGGVRLVSAITPKGEVLSGVLLPPGSGSWSTLSDRSAKTDFTPVDQQKILKAVIDLPISAWRYRGQAESIHHIGPVSQDFYTAFGIGEGSQYISMVDADGVALAAIQGMYVLIQKQDSIIQEQEGRLNEIETRLVNLEQLTISQQNSQPDFTPWLGWFLLIGFVCWNFCFWWQSYKSGLSRRKP
jgi:hypothetical protein